MKLLVGIWDVVLLDAPDKCDIKALLAMRVHFKSKPAVVAAAKHADNLDVLLGALNNEAVLIEKLVHRVYYLGHQVLYGGKRDVHP